MGGKRKAGEMVCASCGADALLLRTPLYEGFTRTGEQLSCSACGHVFETEADVDFKQDTRPKVFAEEDRPQALHVFDENENRVLCRYCKHYVVNPFTQWCSLHRRETEATATCDKMQTADPEATKDGSAPPF